MMSALSTTAEPPALMIPIAPPDDEPPVDADSSFALVIRARAGDQAAVEQLFSRYSTRLRRWAHGRLPAYARNYGDTHDLVQDTMVHVFKGLVRFEPSHRGAFLAFVRRTLRNCLIDRLRSAKSRGSLEPLNETFASQDPSPHDAAVASELLARYEHSFEKLKTDYQEAIFVRVELGLSWPEVMDVLHKSSIASAQMMVHRAILALAHEMDHERKR